MKVLHILNELKHSGAEVMLQVAYGNFKTKGIDSHILSTGTEVGDYAAILQKTGYRIHHIPFRKSVAFFVALGKLLNTERFHAVHIHTERAFIWFVVLAKLAGVPTVIRTFHNVFLFSFYLRWKRKLQRQVSGRICRTIHVAISESVQTVEKERFNNDCIFIRNWTDLEKFRAPNRAERTAARSRYNLNPDDFTIVTVGSCEPQKNHSAIFSAVKKANESLSTKIILLHVGSGPTVRDEELYVHRLGIEQYCRFIGMLDDVRPCLYAADAFVMTSSWEGLPIAAVEAMSAGLPAILYNVYGLRDLVQDGRGGLLVEPNEDCLVEALLKISQSPELTQTYGQQAREKIVNNYSREPSVDRLIHLYTMGNCN